MKYIKQKVLPAFFWLGIANKSFSSYTHPPVATNKQHHQLDRDVYAVNPSTSLIRHLQALPMMSKNNPGCKNCCFKATYMDSWIYYLFWMKVVDSSNISCTTALTKLHARDFHRN